MDFTGKMNRFVVAGLLFVPLVLFFTVQTPDGLLFAATEVAPRVGFTAPDFQLQDLEGKTIRLGQFRGRPIFLNFWASWCPACRHEASLTRQLHELLAPKGVKFVSISIDRGPNAVQNVWEFVTKFGFAFTPLWDSNGEVSDLYRVTAIPTTFLIDRNGKIVAKEIGPKVWTDPKRIEFFETLIEQLN